MNASEKLGQQTQAFRETRRANLTSKGKLEEINTTYVSYDVQQYLIIRSIHENFNFIFAIKNMNTLTNNKQTHFTIGLRDNWYQISHE